MTSSTWRSGDALPGVMRTVTYGHSGAWRVTRRFPRSAKAVAHAVLAMECLFPVAFSASGRLAPAFVGSAAAFHAANAGLMGLGRFVGAFCAMHPAVLYVADPRRRRAAGPDSQRRSDLLPAAAAATAAAGLVVGAAARLRRRKATLVLNVSPAVVARIAGPVLPPSYLRKLARYRYGPGSCKLDLLLSGPVPWTAPDCARAGTLHLVGSREEAIAAAAAVQAGVHARRPYVLAVQPDVVDPGRAPAGQYTLSAYCHVPNGSTLDASAAVMGQLERFAPGVRDLVVDSRVLTADQLARYNPSYAGGNITSGALTLLQTARRPRPGMDPYATPAPGVYQCSAASPPGPGVHGMAGVHVARRILRRHFGISTDPLDLLRRGEPDGLPETRERSA